MPFVINFRVDNWPESMLSITASKECSIGQLVIHIVEYRRNLVFLGVPVLTVLPLTCSRNVMNCS